MTNETKHTPRPWHYYLAPRGHNWIIAGPNDEAVGATGTEANAALSTAAPELVLALQNLVAWANIQDHHSPQAIQVRDNALSAIAQATG